MKKRIFCYCSLLILSLVFCNSISAQEMQNSIIKSKKGKSVPLDSFKHSDIGSPAITGTVMVNEDGFDITAGGTDIWGVKDEFNFVYIEKIGDFDLVSRIKGLTAPHLYTKAGLMAREELTANCRHIYFQVFPNNNPRNKNNGGFEFQYRQERGGEMKAIYPERYEGTPDFPVLFPDTWIRLQRVKNDFTGYWSMDGRNWKVYTTFSLALPEKVFLGPAVTSHKATESASAMFRDIREIKH